MTMKARWLHIRGHESRDYYLLGVDQSDGSFKTYGELQLSRRVNGWLYGRYLIEGSSAGGMTLEAAKAFVERRLRDYYHAYKDLESL